LPLSLLEALAQRRLGRGAHKVFSRLARPEHGVYPGKRARLELEAHLLRVWVGRAIVFAGHGEPHFAIDKAVLDVRSVELGRSWSACAWRNWIATIW